MPLNKGYPTKNTIVTPKVNHHTLHSPSYGLSIEGFMPTKTNSKLGFKRKDVNNLRPSIEFILSGITSTKTETFSDEWHIGVPLATKIIGVPTIDGAIIMVCVW